MKSMIFKTVFKGMMCCLPAVLVLLHCSMRDGDVKGRLNPLDPLIEKPEQHHILTSYIAVSDKWSNFSFHDSTGSIQCSLMQVYEYIALSYGETNDSLQTISLNGVTKFTIDGFRVNHPYVFKFTGYFRNGETRSETFTDTTPSGVPPLPPSDVRGEGTLQGAVIQWDAVANAQGYTIERSTSTGEPVVLLRQNTVCTDPLPDYNLYRYRVGSVNKSGAAFSESVVEIRKISMIAPPDTCIASRGLYPDYVLLNWDRVDSAVSYRVYRAVSAAGMFTAIGAVSDTMFKDTTDVKGALYYRIASVDDSGFTGRPGNSAMGWIVDSIGAPDSVSATLGVLSDRIMVFWKLVRGAASFKIYKAAGPEGSYQLLGTVPGSINYFTDSLINRVVNYYKVSVVDSNGIESQKSVYAKGSIKPLPVPKPYATQGTSISEITIMWESVQDADHYTVYGSTKENGKFDVVLTTNETTVIFTAGVDSIVYFRVSCVIAGIESEQSETVHGWIKSDNTVSNLTASLGTYYTHVALQWQKFEGVQKYVVYRATTASGPYIAIATVDTNGYNDSTVLTDDYYYYRVAAVLNDSTIGKQSDYSMGFAETFNSPGGINASDNYPKKIYVRWNIVPYSQYYVVYRSLTSSGLVPIDTISDTIFIDSLLPNNAVSAYYQVRAGVGALIGLQSAIVRGSLLSPPSSVKMLSQDAGAFITWSTVSNVKQYNVYRSYSNQNSYRLIDTTTDPYTVDTVFTDTGTYYYRITSVNEFGESVTGLIFSLKYLPGPKTINAAVLNDTVKIWWPGIRTGVSYAVFRSQYADTGFESIGTAYDTVYRDIKPPRSGDYYYQVRPNLSSSTYVTSRSPVVKVTVVVKPLAPAVSASTSYQGYVRISWTYNTSGSVPTSYVVYRSTSSSGTYIPLDTVTGTYMNDSVPSTSNYYYKVSGINNAGEGPQSSYAYGYALSPSAPVAVSASWDGYTTGILFTWRKNSSAAAYIIGRSTSSGGTRTVLDTISDTTFFDTTTSANVTRYYSVRLITSKGLTSSYSSDMSGRRLGPPTSIVVTGYTNYLFLSWTGSSAGGIYYKIYRATSSDGPFTILDSTTGSTYSDTVTSLNYYYYKISSVKNGESAQSSAYSGQLTPPSAPVMVSASSGTSALVTVVWRKTSGALSYKIYRSGSSSFTNPVLVGSPVDTFYTDTVPSDSFYYYKSKSVSLVGESSLSSSYVRGYRSPSTVPPVPQSFHVNSNSSSYIYMYWTMSSGIPATYTNKIYRSESQAGPFAAIDSVTGSSYNDYVPKTFPDKYWYYVTSKNAAGESASSDTLSGSRQ